MIGSPTKRCQAIAGAAMVLLFCAAGPVHAVVPEIKVDPTTGIAEPIADLTLALAAIQAEAETIQLAENFWQRAPWHRS